MIHIIEVFSNHKYKSFISLYLDGYLNKNYYELFFSNNKIYRKSNTIFKKI